MNDDLTRAVRDSVGASGADSARVAAELGAITRLVLSAPRLAKALAASDASHESKVSLLTDLTKNAFSATSIGLVAKATERRITGRKLGQSLLQLTAEFVFVAAEAEGNIEAIERQLYEFAALVANDDSFRDALTNPGVTDEVKDHLIVDLLSNKALPVVLELVRACILSTHGRDADLTVRALSYRAAELRNLLVAEVETAIELDPDQQRRLNEALTQSMGRSVESRFTVNPSILGSVIVRIGDEVLDGSVRHRLNQARQAVLGA